MNVGNANALHIFFSRRINPGGTYDELLTFPPYSEIQIVNACNAMCPMADWERGFKTMTDALFKKASDEVIEHADEVKRISQYRDGEPLNDKKLPSRVAIMKDAGIKHVDIATNGFPWKKSKPLDLVEA